LRLRRGALFLCIALAGCAIDLGTKSWIFGELGNIEVVSGSPSAPLPAPQPPIWLVDEVFGFETSLNEGALFGLGQGQVRLFAGLSIVALLGITYWLFFAGACRDHLLTISLGCVSAGILGNLYDRAGLPGLKWSTLVDLRRGHDPGDAVHAVRDWLHFKIDAINFDWPIFNLADSLLVCGALILLWHALMVREPGGAAKPADKTDDRAK
jgi:signal peptidase II